MKRLKIHVKCLTLPKWHGGGAEVSQEVGGSDLYFRDITQRFKHEESIALLIGEGKREVKGHILYGIMITSSSQSASIQIPALFLTTCVTEGRLVDFSVPQIPSL